MFPANRQVITRDQLRRVGLTLDEYNELVNNGDVIMADQAARDAALITHWATQRCYSVAERCIPARCAALLQRWQLSL